MIQLCCEYLSVWWLCLLNMSHTGFRVNLHSECQRTACSKQAFKWLKFKWLQRNLKPQPLVRTRKVNCLAKLAKWLSCIVSTCISCIWLCVLFMSHARFRVNLLSVESILCNFKDQACFEQGVPWHSDSYRVNIYSKRRMWHDNNTQSNAPYS